MQLHSSDGQADLIEENFTPTFSTSWARVREEPILPALGGMLWYTNGDMRRWGSQYWWANTSSYYVGLICRLIGWSSWIPSSRCIPE